MSGGLVFRSWRRWLPWGIALALLGVALWRIDGAALAQALHGAAWGRLALAGVGFTLLWLVLDSLVLARLISRFHRPVGVRQLLPLRAASYVFLPLSYDAAQAALALAVSRRHGIPLLTLGGTFLAYYWIDVLTIAGLGTIGAASVAGPIGAGLRAVLPFVFAGLVALGLLLALLARRPEGRVPGRLRRARVLDTARRARLVDVLEFAAWRLAFYASFVAFVGVTLPAFGIRVPWTALVAIVPVTMSIAALPVTAAGVGSTQLAMLVLYGAYASEASILAYSLVYTASLVLLRLPLGLACLPAASDVLAARRPEHAASAAGEPTT